MAFLLPLELLGTAIAGTLEEVVGSKVAQAAGAAVVAKVGEAINNELYTIAESVVGQENADKVKDAVKETEDYVFSSFSSYRFGSQEWIEEQVRKKKEKDAKEQERLSKTVEAFNAVPVVTSDPLKDQTINGPVVDIDPMEESPEVESSPDTEQPSILDAPPSATFAGGPYVEDGPEQVDPEKIADLISDHVDLLIKNNYSLFELIDAEGKTLVPNKDIQYINKELVGNNAEKLSYFQRMSNYYADMSLSKSNEFKEIFNVYNGAGISPENVVWSENGESWFYDLYDETGFRMTLEQKKDAYTVPAVYGVFGGAFSPNNAKPVDVPDTCFMAHDWGFSISYFAWKEDMKLCSRLVQNRDKWPVNKVNQLNSIVMYFSTIGSTIATIKGSIVGDPSKGPIIDNVTDDLYASIVKNNVSREQYSEDRYYFYKLLADRIEKRRTINPLINKSDSVIRSKLKNLNLVLL